jgi:hypothetical protein
MEGEMKRTTTLSLGMLCILIAAYPAAATDITIYNHSFQDGPKNIDIPAWGDVDKPPEAPYDSPWSVCQEGPDAPNFFNGIGVDGTQFALVDAGGYYAYQDTGATFVSGASYDLVVAVGRRQDHDDLGWADTAWQISLNYAADGTEVASLTGAIGFLSGGFMSDQALHYVAQPQDAGQTIQVRIGGGAATGSTPGYDNVRLTTDAIIEPPPPGTILNYSFEEGGRQVDIPQWGDIEAVQPENVYQEGPNSGYAGFFPDGGVDGDYFALVDPGSYAYQETSTTFVVGESYDLVVAVGRRQDHDDLGWADTPWQISLNYADGTEVASLTGLIGLGSGGSMSDQTLHYVAQPEDAGKAIQVRIGGTTEAGSTVGYDNVRLNIGSEPLLLGDANDDGVVDDKDASILGAHWLASGATWADGDFNNDKVVDDKDAAILAAHWGQGAQENSVPEPATWILIVLGLAVLVVRRCLR